MGFGLRCMGGDRMRSDHESPHGRTWTRGEALSVMTLEGEPWMTCSRMLEIIAAEAPSASASPRVKLSRILESSLPRGNDGSGHEIDERVGR